MSLARVGIDVGATKTAVRALIDGDTIDVIVPSSGWEAEPPDDGAAWIDAVLNGALGVAPASTALAVGAQGLDAVPVASALTRALAARGYAAVVCVNDAALLVPAAGLTTGIGLIAGTGAIGVGADAAGTPMFAGGWGAVIGDDAGAAGIVREAAKAALAAHEDGEPDDGLLTALLEAFGVADAERLARAVNDDPTVENWAPRAPAVFAAADSGSALALGVVDHAAEHLCLLVDRLRRRGAVGRDVVASGGVISAQPRLFRTVRALLAHRHPELRLTLLQDAPVAGALATAIALEVSAADA